MNNIQKALLDLFSNKVPSEFIAPVDYVAIFEAHGLPIGRYISSGKSAPKGHIAVFNGNVITEKAGKIWFGDLDVTASFDTLKNIADEIGEDLYIVRESDARFDNENAGFKYWKNNAVTVILAKCKNCKK